MGDFLGVELSFPFIPLTKLVNFSIHIVERSVWTILNIIVSPRKKMIVEGVVV